MIALSRAQRGVLASLMMVAGLVSLGSSALAKDLKYTSGYVPYEDGAEALVTLDHTGPTEDKGIALPGCDATVDVIDESGVAISSTPVTARPRIANVVAASLPTPVSEWGFVRFDVTYTKSKHCSPKVFSLNVDVLPPRQPTKPDRRLTTMSRYRIASLIK